MPLAAPARNDSPRLRVRLIEEADLEALMAVNGDAEVTRFLPYATWKSMDDARAWFARMAGLQSAGNALQFVVVDKSSGSAIGTCLLFRFDEIHGQAELGFVLGRSHWGGGYMREALACLLDAAFGAMALRRLDAQVDPRNAASRVLLQRLGFTREGLLRERYIEKGAPCDIELFGLLSREWRHA